MNVTRSTETCDAALGLARQALYRFCSLALSDPRSGAVEALRDPSAQEIVREAAALLREQAPGGMDLAPGERPSADLLPERVIELLPATPHAWNGLHERAFGLLAAGTCPPHETDYIPAKQTYQRSNGLADVSGFYRAFGLRPSSRSPERHDHITLELEFMALAIDLERRALESGAPEPGAAVERAEICRSAQRRFLAEHLAWWAPAFARLLARQAPGGYHAACAVLLAALVPIERAILGVPAPVRAVRPETIEPPDACGGCFASPEEWPGA